MVSQAWGTDRQLRGREAVYRLNRSVGPTLIKGGQKMNIFETIGLAWVIFTSSLASVAILYLSLIGLKAVLRKITKEDTETVDVPVEVKEMFKIAR